MALLVYLVVAALVFAVMRGWTGRRLWMRRQVLSDTEKGVAIMPGTNNNERESSRQVTLPQSIQTLLVKFPYHYDDSQAANDQLLSEFAASTALDCSLNSDSAHPDARTPQVVQDSPDDKSSPLLPEEQPILVNPKQFHRILKRRAARQALEDSLRLMAKRMEKGRELRSMRGFDGVVVGAVR